MAINSKSTKAEILAAFKALEKEKKALQAAQKNNPQNTPSTRGQSSTHSKNQPAQKPANLIPVPNKIPSQLSQRDIAKTISILEHLQVGFGGAVSNLSEQLIAEATALAEIRQLISDEQTQLTELHELDEIGDNTIDELIELYQDSHKQFSEEFTTQSEAKRQLISELIKDWRKERENQQRNLRLRDEERRKTQQRDREEYQYNLDLARDLDEETYETEKKAQYQELAEIRQELEQQWQAKEEAIAKQEQEYTEAQAKVTAFEEQLRKKIKQGSEEGKGIGAYQTKVKLDLRRQEIAGEEQNYQLRVQALQQTIDTQEARIQNLNQQLDLAQKQVQDLAVKAIEGTANRQSYEAMKEIAMEQAKTQQKGK